MRSDEKPVRDLEAIMQREQDKAALESEAAAAADQARYDKNTSFQDIGCTGTSDSMELCDTTEMLEMFAEYYDADKEDAASRSVNASTIESAYDFNDKCFGLTYQGEGSFIEVPRNDHGDCDEEFDLGALVSNASVAQSRSLLCDM